MGSRQRTWDEDSNMEQKTQQVYSFQEKKCVLSLSLFICVVFIIIIIIIFDAVIVLMLPSVI